MWKVRLVTVVGSEVLPDLVYVECLTILVKIIPPITPAFH